MSHYECVSTGECHGCRGPRVLRPDIDCGACEPACPAEAITEDRHVEEGSESFIDDSAGFFTTVLPGRRDVLGEQPGGARRVGSVGADTALVAAFSTDG